MARTVKAEVLSSTFDEMATQHVRSPTWPSKRPSASWSAGTTW
jgi:transcription termination factor Rho